MSAVNQSKEKLQIVGFVNKNWAGKSFASINADNIKIYDDFSNKDLKVLAVHYNDKHKDKSEFQLFNPNDIKLVNDTVQPTH